MREGKLLLVWSWADGVMAIPFKLCTTRFDAGIVWRQINAQHNRIKRGAPVILFFTFVKKPHLTKPFSACGRNSR